MKKSLIISIFVLIIFSGCTPQMSGTKVGLKNPKYYKQSLITIKLPYSKAAKNLEKGIQKCAEDITTGTVVSSSGTRMPGNSYYHQFKSTKKQTEYNFKILMGGISEGDCSTCQPKGGYFVINSTIKKSKKGHSIFTANYGSTFESKVLALKKWAEGDLSSCHGFD